MALHAMRVTGSVQKVRELQERQLLSGELVASNVFKAWFSTDTLQPKSTIRRIRDAQGNIAQSGVWVEEPTYISSRRVDRLDLFSLSRSSLDACSELFRVFTQAEIQKPDVDWASLSPKTKVIGLHNFWRPANAYVEVTYDSPSTKALIDRDISVFSIEVESFSVKSKAELGTPNLRVYSLGVYGSRYEFVVVDEQSRRFYSPELTAEATWADVLAEFLKRAWEDPKPFMEIEAS